MKEGKKRPRKIPISRRSYRLHYFIRLVLHRALFSLAACSLKKIRAPVPNGKPQGGGRGKKAMRGTGNPEGGMGEKRQKMDDKEASSDRADPDNFIDRPFVGPRFLQLHAEALKNKGN